MIGWIVALFFIVLLTCTFVTSNNKILNTIVLIVMWILIAFGSDTADYGIYHRRFYSPESESLEPLFYILIKFLNFFGFDLPFFVFFIGTMYIVALYKIIKDWHFNMFSGYVLSMYCIYPFCIDISQLRNTLGLIPILIGFRYLNNNLKSKTKKNEIIFFVCVIISTLIHYAGIFFILLLLAKKIDIKKSVMVTSIIVIAISTLTNFENILLVITSKFGVGFYRKVWTVMNNVIMQDKNTINGTKKMVLLTFVLIMFILVKEYRKTFDVYIEYIIKVNILVMIILPMLDYSVDLFRIQRDLLIFTYIAFAKCLNSQSDNFRKLSVKTFIFKIYSLIVPFTGLYLNILRSGLFDGVIVPIFESNLLFK